MKKPHPLRIALAVAAAWPALAIAAIRVLTPDVEGTRAELASNQMQIRALLEGGLTPGDAILPRTTPENLNQLELGLRG